MIWFRYYGGVQLFFSYFKDLVGKEVTVELKNDLAIRGTLHSVDQYLNIKLENTRVVDQDKYPHMVLYSLCCLKNPNNYMFFFFETLLGFMLN
jgi:small nuclear ribonucleoprotein (snRNP)-like protein